jgi:hypothetical protein
MQALNTVAMAVAIKPAWNRSKLTSLIRLCRQPREWLQVFINAKVC